MVFGSLLAIQQLSLPNRHCVPLASPVHKFVRFDKHWQSQWHSTVLQSCLLWHNLEIGISTLHEIKGQDGVAAIRVRIRFCWATATQVDIARASQFGELIERTVIFSEALTEQRQVVTLKLLPRRVTGRSEEVRNDIGRWSQAVPSVLASVLPNALGQKVICRPRPTVHLESRQQRFVPLVSLRSTARRTRPARYVVMYEISAPTAIRFDGYSFNWLDRTTSVPTHSTKRE
jgi:hypothetical protein